MLPTDPLDYDDPWIDVVMLVGKLMQIFSVEQLKNILKKRRKKISKKYHLLPNLVKYFLFGILIECHFKNDQSFDHFSVDSDQQSML